MDPISQFTILKYHLEAYDASTFLNDKLIFTFLLLG